MQDTNTTYAWGIPLTVAYLDILGFKSALEHTNPPVDTYSSETNSGNLIFSLWGNCLPPRDRFAHSPQLNFVQMSDSLVVYGVDPDKVLGIVCDIFGSALSWGVPIRGGLGFGILNHAESLLRPGTVLSFFGAGLSNAYSTEQAHGVGMRLLMSDDFIEHASVEGRPLEHGGRQLREFPWWLRTGIDHARFKELGDLWWTKRIVGKWFMGPNRADAEKVFKRAHEELETLRPLPHSPNKAQR
jgi:hypothetical protein